MAPLTLVEKYDDLVRCADQPISSYDGLTKEDLDDVLSNTWPFIIESITYIPLSLANDGSPKTPFLLNGEVRTKLDRRLKIQFPLYSNAATKHQQNFPNRKPIKQNKAHTNTNWRDTRSLSLDASSTFSFDDVSEINLPDFHVFCTSKKHSNERKSHHGKQLVSAASKEEHQTEFDRVRKYLMTTPQTSPYRLMVFKQALIDCCRCGNYFHLKSLCSAADTTIEKISFDNNDTILHKSIELNNKQLTTELIRYRFDVNVDGELGTPLVTAMHHNILWAIEILLNNGADLTKRHIDWPLLTLYEYCIQFAKIHIKSMIDKHIVSLIHKGKYAMIQKLINDSWNISLKQRRHIFI